MVLVQFLISQANNNTDFIVPVSGKCSIRVLGCSFWDSDNTNHCHPITIRSDVLFFPYSPQRYLTFLSHNTSNTTIDSGLKEYNIYATIPGKIHLNVVNGGGNSLDHNFYAVISLELEQLNRDWDTE